MKPPLHRRLANLFRAGLHVAAYCLAGRPVITPPAIRKRRSAVCRRCVHFVAESELCEECGCFMPAKIALASESCPLPHPKWKALTH